MAFWDRVRKTSRLPSARKANPVMSAILQVGPFRAKWLGSDYETMARDAYGTNPYVYASIRQIAMAFAGLKWRAYSDATKKKEIPNHPVLDLIRRPNAQQGQGRFMENFIGYLLIDGNSFIVRSPIDGGPPDELYCLRPDRITITPGNVQNPIANYIYQVGAAKTLLPPESVLHMKYFNPLDDWYGLSPLQAARYSVTQSNESKAWNVALLQNGARTSGALATEYNVDDIQYTRLREMIDEHAGWSNAGRTLILEGGLKWQEMGLTPDEMSWADGQKISARELAMIYNIAPELIGDPESKTFSNYGEAREALYEENILPMASWFRDDLNAFLSNSYSGGVYVDYDRDNIEALQEDRTKVFARNDASVKAGWITIGQAQKLAGVDVDPVYGKYYRWQLPNFAPADPLQEPPAWAQPKTPALPQPGQASDGAPQDSPIGHNTPVPPATPGTPGRNGNAKALTPAGGALVTVEDLQTFTDLFEEMHPGHNGKGNHRGHEG